ncbi:BamA/TamA family outer membrane protein [Aegicerativicinus sediminis]|uniref:BamA/TamA family outer membrane protein n=1 Tax=Aegicerativicinus sediminis TaxID=2893202 RepID=UPI001E4140B3|nr:BamA/TamA family outer membrane protein [Aegicerativicinus sediminis]
MDYLRRFLVAIILLSSGVGFAQKIEGDTIQKTPKTIDFKLMPYLGYNRDMGFMFGAIPMIMYRLNSKDSLSPKSMSGATALYTTNNSYFVALFNRFFLNEDKWRITMFGVTGNHYSQFFLDFQDASDFYDYNTKTTIASIGFQRLIKKHFYLGLNYTYSHYDTDYEDEVLESSITQTNGLEVNTQYDNRNSIYYPTDGFNARIKWLMIPEWFSNDNAANKLKFSYNQYFGQQNDRDVIAARFSALVGLGELPFEQQETIGGKDIRGYSEGKYRGDGIIALQGEYRFNFHSKMGLVAFGGLSTLYGSANDDFNWKLYPGAGAGFRYLVFDEEHFNIGIDAAVGKKDWGIYFRIGEAF